MRDREALKLIAQAAVILAFARGLWIALRTFKRLDNNIRGMLLIGTFFIMGFENFLVPAQEWRIAPGLLSLAAGVALLEWSRRSIEGLFFSFIGNRDTPHFVFQEGPYFYVRHPFYTSYLLMQLAVVIMVPNIVTFATIIVTFVLLWQTAAFEERKFDVSSLAVEYRAYASRTGRLFPRIRR